MSNFQHFQINQQEFDQLAELLLKYPMVCATSKFEVGEMHSSLHLPLNPEAVFKKQRASKVSIDLQDKVNRLLDLLEQYEILSPIIKEEQPKNKKFHKPRYHFCWRRVIKIVFDARYLNSLIIESKCN